MKEDGLENQDYETLMRGMGKILLRAAGLESQLKQLIHENQQLKEQLRASQYQQPQQYQQPPQRLRDRPQMPEF